MPQDAKGEYRMNPQQARSLGSKGKLRCIRIEVGKNGFSVTEEREPTKKPTSKDPFPYQPPDKPSFFETEKATVDYIDRCLKRG